MCLNVRACRSIRYNHTDHRHHHDVRRAQLENAVHALRHALRATTPLIGAVEDGHLAAHIATAAGQVAEAGRSVAACIDVVDGYTHINDVIRRIAVSSLLRWQ